MLATLSKYARHLTAALLLGAWAGPAEAGWWTGSKSEATHQATAARTEKPPADPAVGAAVIAGGVALFILLAWVAVRVGGGGIPANDLPE